MQIHNDLVQGSPEWFLARAGLPTGSGFKYLVTPTGLRAASLDKYAGKLACELHAGEPLEDFDGNYWTKRGLELETPAIANYEMRFDVDVTKVGFVTNATQRKKATYGVSPDGMVGKVGGIEIKSLKHDKYMDYVRAYDEDGTIPSEFVMQVQGLLMLCKLDWVDLILYHPKLPMIVMRSKSSTRIQHALKKYLVEVVELRDYNLEILNKYK